MSTEIKVVKNDKLYDLFFQLQDADGNNLSLGTASEIKIKVQKSNTTVLKFEGVCDIVDANTGEIKYEVQDGNFDEADTYRAEIEVTYMSGQVATITDIKIFCLDDLPVE